VPTLFGVTLLVFIFISLTGNPVKQLLGPEATHQEIQQVMHEFGLDRPLYSRYFFWLGHVLQGDFGRSYATKRPVIEDIRLRFPATLELAVCTAFIATLTSVIIGVLSVRKPGGVFDSSARTVIFVFLAMPGFWLGIELIILFSRKVAWFPPSGRGEGSWISWAGLNSHLSHLALPAITLGVGTGAVLCRLLRASLLEVLNSDFIRTAQAKGLSGRIVLLRHALRNALIPFITVGGIAIGGLLEGSIIVETVFSWPGMGLRMIEAIKSRDVPMAMSGVLLFATVYILVNFFVDILYVVIDPRVRLEGGAGPK
jgi:ABC-type dipeptide/oligopeptide/nickel transport system permease component